jgi:hypothetical protein
MLTACNQVGLANAVAEKEQDRNFVKALSRFVKAGRFDNLPTYAPLSAQSMANGFSTGYRFGYQQAVSLLIGSDVNFKTSVCDAAVTLANDILK